MDVLFAVLPFADVGRPAIGVSLLQAEIARQGFSSRVRYFNLALAETIGQELYLHLANSFPPDSLIGEWLFAGLLFGDQLPDERDYIARILSKYSTSGPPVSDILNVRRGGRDFVERCAQEILNDRPRVVGFTTTFHQTCACLAVARRLKQSAAPPVIIFGGANCEGEMGLQMLRSFPWIDYVCSGGGDLVFPPFLQRLLRDGETGGLPGILKQGECPALTSPESVLDMDSLPIPDYSDYFARLRDSPLRAEIKPDLLIETSRGCWWGAKSHCTFCGLNGATMAYRSKSPERVIEELSYLARTYGLSRIECVDNILDMNYTRTLFPRLSESGLNLELFYEIKANLKRPQLAALRAGGVNAIQPGLESLSNEVLRLMRKGCTGLQNIQLLRWSEELGVDVAWNILFGFPGEPPAEYERMARLLPLLTHLQPPASCAPFRLDRFSPYFTSPEQFGLVRVRPMQSYYYVYPLGRRELSSLAYYFEFDFADARDPYCYTGALRREVQNWWECRGLPPERRPRLEAVETGDAVLITDTRAVAVKPAHRLEGLAAQVYLLCDVAQTPVSLSRELGREEHAVRDALDALLAARLTVEAEGQYLSLAVMRDRVPQEGEQQRHVRIPLEQAKAA